MLKMTSETPPLNATTFGGSSSTSSVMDTHRITPPSIPSTPNSSSQQNPSQQQQQQQHQQQQHQQQQQNQHQQQQHQISSTPIQNPSSSQEFCLRWNNYQSNLTSVFDQLLQSESFVDVTLACDGHSIKAHKMVLSACSPYFQTLFFDNPCQHPIIIMRDVKWPELKAVVEFMYKGEINVNQDQIGPLLRVAEMLKIRGLADVNTDQELNASPTQITQPILSDITTKKQIISREWDVENLETINTLSSRSRKRRWPSAENSSIESPIGHETPDNIELPSPTPLNSSTISQPSSTPTPLTNFSIPPPLETMGLSSLNHPDDMEIKPGIAEMIREEERAKLMENSHPWLGASTSSISDYSSLLKLKTPTWTQAQLRDAIHAVVTQKMRFTQAAARYNIPKGTLYDNILGKSNRMQVLEEAALDIFEEKAVLEYCCDVSVSPYNRRTKKSLSSILEFVHKLKKNTTNFIFNGKTGFRWWWAFCKKYSIVSLHYDSNANIRLIE